MGKGRILRRITVVLLAMIMALLVGVPDVGLVQQEPVTAANKKAIIIIPGIGGTSLREKNGDHLWVSFLPAKLQKLACSEIGDSLNTLEIEDSTLHIGEAGCNVMYMELYSSYYPQYDVKIFRYDWRLGCSSAAEQLQQLVQNYSNIIIVAHSMGGLVASKYLALSKENRLKTSKVIAIGTPFTGAVKGLHVMETGDFSSFLSLTSQKDTIKSLVCNFPSVYELLPTSHYLDGDDPYIEFVQNNGSTRVLTTSSGAWGYMSNRPWGKKSNGFTKPMFNEAKAFHSSLELDENGEHVANGLTNEFHMIIGIGQDTPSKIIYNNDKTVKKYEMNNNGDGTVTSASAVFNRGANTVLHVRSSHVNLMSNSSVINMVKKIIAGTDSSIPSTININQKNSLLNFKQQTNEKGWIIGEDNDRTEVIVYSGELGKLKNSKGEDLIIDGDTIYYKESENGVMIPYGSVWDLGNQSYQYVFKNNDVSFTVESFDEKKCEMEISYLSNGYYTKSVSCSIPSSTCFVMVSSNVERNISVSDNSGKPVALSERSMNQLAEMNQ